MTINAYITNILCLLCLFLPFNSLGILYGDFVFSIIFLPYLCLIILEIINKKFDKINFMIFLLVILVFFLSAVYKHSLASFLPSLFVFGLLIFPFTFNYRSVDTTKLFRYFCLSFLFLFFYCFFEFIISLFSNDLIFKLEKIIGFQGSTTTYRNLRRLRGGFLEPSIMSLVLNMYLYIFLNTKFYFFYFKRHTYIIFSILLILLTFSTLGYLAFLVMITYYIFNNKNVISKNISYNYILFILPLFYLIKYFWAPIYKAYEKFTLIIEVIQTNNITGSVGFRINSLIMGPQFIYDSNMLEKLLGTGYSNYTEYIKSIYGYNEFSGFSDGTIGNILSATLISTGLIGFILFSIFIYNVLFKKDKSYTFNTLVIIFFLGTGNLIAPWLWLTLLIINILKRNN